MIQAHYAAYKLAQGVNGDIVEVGLGDGEIVRSVADEERVKSFTSYEIDSDVVDTFRNVNPGFHAKHTINAGDFMLAPIGKKYDIGIVDLFYGRASYAGVKDIVTQLKKHMKVGGKIMVEYIADFPEERDFRAFMEAEISPMATEHINTGNKQTSRHVCYYTIT